MYILEAYLHQTNHAHHTAEKQIHARSASQLKKKNVSQEEQKKKSIPCMNVSKKGSWLYPINYPPLLPQKSLGPPLTL